MRVQSAKKVHYDSGPNMTPLVDVVMVILIFLMLAGTFAGAEQYISSNMPITQTGALPKEDLPTDKPLPDPPVQIFVDSYGTGYTAYVAGLPKVRDGEALRSQLVQTLNKLGKAHPNASGKMVDSDTPIQISPDMTAKWQFLIDVYQSALEAGFTKVGFATSH